MTFRDYSYGSRVLGQGYSSVVYKAKKYKSKNQFALKIIKEDFIKSDAQKQLLLNEITIHQAVKNHKNFVHLFQHGPYQNTYAFVMELCDKGSLADVLLKSKNLSEAQAIYIIKEVIEAYRLMYSLNVLHRDIKPGNILITQKNQIKLCDFGLSVNSSDINDIHSFRIGTPCFMAPEVARASIYTQKSDIWSIGVTYYLMLIGQLPFKSQNHQNFLKQVKQANLETTIPAILSDFSKQFILRTLNPNSYQRMSAQELFSFSFQNPPKQLTSYLSQKQLRPKSTKNKLRTFDKSKSTKNLQNILPQKTAHSNKLNVKESKKTQTTQNSQSSIPPTVKQNSTSKNIGNIQKQTSIQRIHSIAQLSPRNQSSPRKITPSKHVLKEVSKSVIKQMQKITRILINQVDFLRYIGRVSQIVEKYFKGQFKLLKFEFCEYVKCKFSKLRSFSFIDKQNLGIYKNYPLFTAWTQLINDYENLIKPSRQNLQFKQQHLEEQLSKVILDIYLQFDKSIKTKLNASKLIVLDHLICLQALLQMTKKGDSYFLKNSMLHLILQGLENIDIDVNQIQLIFTGISKKLSGGNQLST